MKKHRGVYQALDRSGVLITQHAFEAMWEDAEIAKAEQYRAKVGEYITEDQLQHMDAYIERAYPRGECYAADYWRTLATRLGVRL